MSLLGRGLARLAGLGAAEVRAVPKVGVDNSCEAVCCATFWLGACWGVMLETAECVGVGLVVLTAASTCLVGICSAVVAVCDTGL